MLQAEQCFPSVSPVSVHVASTAASTTSLCPFASTTSCATKIASHTEQCFPSVNPVVVHVASTLASTTSLCPFASTTSCATKID